MMHYLAVLVPIFSGSSTFRARRVCAGRSPCLGRSAGGAAGSRPRGLLQGCRCHFFALRLRSGGPHPGAVACRGSHGNDGGEHVLQVIFPDGV